MRSLILALTVVISCNTDAIVQTKPFCEEYATDELFFEKEEMLTFPMITVFVKPSKDYEFNVDINESTRNLNSIYAPAKISFKNIETVNILDENIDNMLVNYKTYLTLIDNKYGEKAIVKVVFPDDVWFGREMEGDKRVRIIQGAALFIGSNIYFVRESHFSNGVNAHEVGHDFDLLHLFQGPDNSHKGLSCDSGDFVIDTWNDNLDTPLTAEEKEEYNKNIMSYYDTENSIEITKGQIARLRKHIEENHSKRKLIIRDDKKIDYSNSLYSGDRVFIQGK